MFRLASHCWPILGWHINPSWSTVIVLTIFHGSVSSSIWEWAFLNGGFWTEGVIFRLGVLIIPSTQISKAKNSTPKKVARRRGNPWPGPFMVFPGWWIIIICPGSMDYFGGSRQKRCLESKKLWVFQMNNQHSFFELILEWRCSFLFDWNQKPIDSSFTVRNAHTETPKKSGSKLWHKANYLHHWYDFLRLGQCQLLGDFITKCPTD